MAVSNWTKSANCMKVTGSSRPAKNATWFPVTAAQVEAAIWTADALGLNYKKVFA